MLIIIFFSRNENGLQNICSFENILVNRIFNLFWCMQSIAVNKIKTIIQERENNEFNSLTLMFLNQKDYVLLQKEKLSKTQINNKESGSTLNATNETGSKGTIKNESLI